MSGRERGVAQRARGGRTAAAAAPASDRSSRTSAHAAVSLRGGDGDGVAFALTGAAVTIDARPAAGA